MSLVYLFISFPHVLTSKTFDRNGFIALNKPHKAKSKRVTLEFQPAEELLEKLERLHFIAYTKRHVSSVFPKVLH